MIDLPPPSYDQTIQAIAKCDIPRSNIRIEYEDELQSDVVTISDLGDVTDKKFRCLRAAVHPFYILMIENGAQQANFYEFARREDRPREKVEATEWLRSRGLLDRLPIFDPNNDVEQFATALEESCKLAPGCVLMSLKPSTLTVRPDFLQRSDFETTAEALGCITQMFAASDATEHDVRLVFIGNEAFRESDKS